jgi:ketosteroid isomerase-like protein
MITKRLGRAACLAILAAVFAAAGSCGLSAQGQNDPDKSVASLIEAERAFSKTSEEKGIREAFLAYLAEKAIVFRPKPVLGRTVYEKMAPGNPAILTWEPEVAEVSAAGDLGYTSGPYKLKRDKTEKASESYGHYVSVWEKQADGTWLVIRDIGVDHDRPPKPQQEVMPIPPSGLPAKLSEEARKKVETDFVNQVSSFHQAVIKGGFLRAFETFATEDIRLFRPRRFPTSGLESISELFKADEGKVLGTGRYLGQGRLDFKVKTDIRVAATGDLGVAHGTFGLSVGGKTRELTSYVWIWRRKPGGTWRMCLAIDLPVTPADKS